MDISQLEAILKLLRTNEVTEFELEQDGTKIKLVRGSHFALQQAAPVQHSVAHTVEPAVVQTTMNGTPAHSQIGSAAGQAPSIPENWSKVESPIVGTFYRRPSPDAEPYAKEGDLVKKGQTLCIIEAMKLMNEIEAPIGGKIEKVLLNDGQVVEFGETLFLINPAI